MSTKILVLSPSIKFFKEIEQYLLNYEIYSFAHLEEWRKIESTDDHSIALIDEDAIERDPTSYLARISFQLSPLPVIYITSKLDTEKAFTAVRSLTSDFLIKEQLSSASLHNCIRYSLDSWKMQLEMEKQQRKYMSLFFNAVDPCFYLNPDWEIENINQAFTQAFGARHSQCFKKPFYDLLAAPENFEKIQKKFLTNSSATLDTELKFKRLDKQQTFLGHVKITMVQDFHLEGQNPVQSILGYQGSLSNISYKSRLRSIKARSERISLTYRLARTLAHEIRNPLTNITLSMDQLEDEMEQNEVVTTYLNIIKRSTKRIDELLNQLLRSSEQLQLKTSQCDLIEVVNEAITQITDRAKLRNIRVVGVFETEKALNICDKDSILLAIMNLLTNAIEAIDKNQVDGKIILKTYTEDGYWCLDVEDNGVGMTSEVMESLFDPFFTNKKQGIGLGLTASQRIVADHGGEIEVESKAEQGSVFTISLPIK